MRAKGLILIFLLFFQFSYSQTLENKNVLVVWGGWDGHQPEFFANLVEKWLISQKSNYKITNGVEAYDDYDELIKYDLIIQSITMGEIDQKRANNLFSGYVELV